MMNNFMMGPMDRMQHQQGFAPNNPSGGMMGQPPPMAGNPMMGPSPEVLQKLMAMFQGGQNPGGQMMPPQANYMGGMQNGMTQPPMMSNIGMSKPTIPSFTPPMNPMMGGGMKDPNILGGESHKKFNMGPLKTSI